MRNLWVIGLVVVGVGLVSSGTQAKPEYAAKEKKACLYCHVKPDGTGERNARGKYYAAHNRSLAGLPPMFASTWKLEVAPAVRRAAAADVMGDKAPRLLTLGADNTLVIENVTGSKPVQDATVDLGDKAERFAVGQFAKGKPAIVAVPGAVFYRDGAKVARKAVPDLSDITGTVRFVEGGEYVFSWDGAGLPGVWGINPDAEKPLVEGREMVPPDQATGVYASVIARLTPAIIAQMGWPAEVQGASAAGLADLRGDGKLYAWAPWQAKDGDYLAVFDLPGGAGGELKPVWQSPSSRAR
jgi:hypothetical protein